ncbi:NADP-binding protein [Dacryopinax primogenitus]|uniref:NADP-binding protein n=1 Tax=Dacryopinax primogenitus (strain DJM 731) TaxID=1858805 RepID=M5FR51_DACPD|nr:NADP-binding protein [Dacryopinax primogenitus]EJT97349.1 NADP-binding protein [Dacryopinax primogenitus]
MSIPPLPLDTTLQGRSVLITGANVGLGFSAALLALQLGASPLYITCRSAEKGNKARDDLLADPVVRKKNPRAIVKVYELEMSKWDGVTSFAEKFLDDRHKAGEGLDIAILNAAMFSIAYEVAPTGNEMLLQVTYLSTALLSLLLLPLLEKSTTSEHTARLTFITSGMHMNTSLKHCPPDDVNYLASLNDKKTFGASDRYGLTKLLVILFLRHLCEKVGTDKVIINNACPGLIQTKLERNLPWVIAPFVQLMKFTAGNSVEKGATCYIAAVASVGPESHGQWYQRMKLTPYSEVVTGTESKKLQQRIWDETVKQLQTVCPGVGTAI